MQYMCVDQPGMQGQVQGMQESMVFGPDEDTPNHLPTDLLDEDTPSKEREAMMAVHSLGEGDRVEEQKGTIRARNTPRSSSAAIRALVHDNFFAKTPTSGTIVKKRRAMPEIECVAPVVQDEDALAMLAAFVQQC